MNAVRDRRLDIQILRAIAVLSVLAFHGRRDATPFGFLGVDVFFVISGFLMTQMILPPLAEGRFSFRGFYARRARRLVPAGLTTLAVTTALAAVLLTSGEWHDYLRQLFGAFTGTANFFLWRQGGYFTPYIETRPLLHFWSLALEEQFYLLFPLGLFILPRRWRLAALILGCLVSAGLDAYLRIADQYAGATFYLLPTRAWQLLAGALCAYAMLQRPGLSIPPAFKLAALVVLIFTFMRGLPLGLNALMAVSAVSIMLLGQDGWIPRNWLTRALAWCGDISYSLYLVHWPLLAFANIYYSDHPPTIATLTLLSLSFPLAWIQYRFVENPFRKQGIGSPRVKLSLAGAATFACLFVAVAAFRSTPPDDTPPAVTGLGADCGFRLDDSHSDECSTSPKPRVALWGDSEAMHLLPGIVQDPRIANGIAQYTIPSCAPIPGIARLGEGKGYGAECIRFNRLTFDRLRASKTVKVVVVGSSWIMLATRKPEDRLVGSQIEQSNIAQVVRIMVATVRRLEASGKTVLIVGPTPKETFEPVLCNLRKAEGLVTARPSCAVSRATFRNRHPLINRALALVAANTGARLFLPEEVLCAGNRCATMKGTNFIYRDVQHLSQFGSRYVVNRLGLIRAIQTAIDDAQNGS